MEQLTLGVSVPDLSHWIVHCGLIHHGDGGHPVLAVTPRPAGQREGGDGAPPRGAARRSLRSGHGFPVRRKDVAQQGRLKLAEPVPDQRAVGAGGVAGVPGRWGLQGA